MAELFCDTVSVKVYSIAQAIQASRWMKDDLGALILSKKKIKSGTLIPPHAERISGSNLCLSSLPTGWSQGQQISLLILYKQSNKTLGLGGPRKKIQPHLKSYPFRVSERRA